MTKNKNKTGTNNTKVETTDAKPKVVLRTYRDTDYEQVEYLFRSTQVPLVYESIRSKLWALPTWGIWFIVYSGLLISIPKAITFCIGNLPEWAMVIIKIFISFCWAVVGFAIIFISSDRIEIQNRVDEAMANDLYDPDLYYLNYTINKDGKKVRKSESEQVPSHFWVLSIDDEICGMIGLLCNNQDLEDRRETVPVGWKQFIIAVLELFRLSSMPPFLEKQRANIDPGNKNNSRRIFARKQIPKTATITRWAIRSDLQACGLSSLLINRAITWAHEHDINRIYAMTNECCMAAEQILTGRHGFVIMKRYNLNFFGEYNKLFACRVKEWMEKNGEKTRAAFKKSQ
ncbi:uncharacterized protein BX663DRAFT_553670 [Cokeromyces recurvatus]|uniref:uncharacterized protein n=1 Tax=Cokeromyces recurvatus TaxID=90255 RepID=UPI00221E8F08|nr:uncharacterized protein BX663DRAFT_553670 [Cokeromyces recurvatus]KAI7901041.1 hypothetical protein BX663DRAFT_553670 [Cokeromyces recurvatus]